MALLLHGRGVRRNPDTRPGPSGDRGRPGPAASVQDVLLDVLADGLVVRPPEQHARRPILQHERDGVIRLLELHRPAVVVVEEGRGDPLHPVLLVDPGQRRRLRRRAGSDAIPVEPDDLVELEREVAREGRKVTRPLSRPAPGPAGGPPPCRPSGRRPGRTPRDQSRARAPP